MTELGNRLKEARLAKGISLDDLQTITKIQKRYLTGIEEGNYSSMPGNFYVRAFIKQYAEAVQLDPEEIFETYKSEIPATYNEDLPEQLSRVKTRKSFSDKGSKVLDLLPKVLIGVFVIGAAAILYYFLQQHAGTSANQSVDKQNEQVNFAKSKNLEKVQTTENKKKSNKSGADTKKTTDKSVDTAKAETSKQEIAVVSSSGSQTTYQVKNADKFVIKLVTNDKSWVSIKNSKSVSVYQGMLQTGGTDNQTVDLSNDTSALIRVGNARAVDIYVNDKKIDYAVPPDQIVVQNITIQYVPKNK